MKCESCGRSLDNGILVLPWENGNNPTAYVICSHCRHKNTVQSSANCSIFAITALFNSSPMASFVA